MKSHIAQIFAADASYKKASAGYTPVDAALAAGLYLFVTLGYLAIGIVQKTSGVYPGVPFNLLSIALCFLLLAMRKQKPDSIGLTAAHIKKSILTGLISGALFSLLNIIPAISSGGRWAGFNAAFLLNIIYYFIVIGFQEEIVFRGYIQTRLYGAVKSDVAAILICGLMFMAMHIPFQMYNRNSGDLIGFLSENYVWLLLTFMWHIVFNFLYRKFNSIAAPTIAHGLMNLSSTLFR